MKGKKWTPDAALVARKKKEQEVETHQDGVDLAQQKKDQTFFQGTIKSGDELAAIESELDETAKWEAELKAKQGEILLHFFLSLINTTVVPPPSLSTLTFIRFTN